MDLASGEGLDFNPNNTELANITDDNLSVAKLNLAAVYISMGDHQKAKNALNEVLAIGDDKQCREARRLLSKFS
jgi:FimV-like protein